MRIVTFLLLSLTAGILLLGAGRSPEIAFRVHTLDLGSSEACTFADINKDGRLDVVSGENWYEAPLWKRHHFRDLGFNSNYIDDFSDMAVDVNGDGYPDIVSVSWFARRTAWWKNPGKSGGAWVEAPVDSGASIEFALLVDLNNDGKAQEVLPQPSSGPLAWYEVKDGAWVKHVVSQQSYWEGIGAGDVNGDGRTDILTSQGWLEAPPDPRSGDWKFHPDWNEKNLGFLHVLDVDGDGRNDIVTSYGHNYGIFWMRQTEEGKWTKSMIDANAWSQAHATTLVDLNGDGQLDLLTGKRFMAHNGGDPGEREPLGVYWYERYKQANGSIGWIRHVIEYGGRIGGGMEIPAADIDGDGDIDFACAGKGGLFLFENLTKKPAPARPVAASKTK